MTRGGWALVGWLALVACQPQVTPGTPCARDAECGGLVCRLGRCRSACAVNRDCPVGSQCFLVSDGVGACQLDVDRNCGGGCATGLSCFAEQCLRPCHGAADCPSDGACAIGSGASVGVCTDARDVDAGPTNDAAPADAALDAADAGAPACAVVTEVCIAGGTTCARAEDGTVACWGYDINHQTGGPSTGEQTSGGVPYRSRPSLVRDEAGSLVQLTQLSCSDLHACGVTAAGEVLCWGTVTYDLRADGSTMETTHATPAMFDEGSRLAWGDSGAPRASHVAVGREHACAMSTDGDLRCWGHNRHGEIGTGDPTDRTFAPVEPTVLTAALMPPYAGLAVGDGITCIVNGSGALACVGHSEVGVLGASVTPPGDAVSTAADPGLTIDPAHASTSLAIGQEFLCGRDATGAVSCLGANGRHELGRATTDPSTTAMRIAAGTTAFDTLWSGSMASGAFAIVGGVAYAWGDNDHGGLAAPLTDTVRAVPQRTGMTMIERVSVDQGSACAVSDTGVLTCWGKNDRAQLGRGAVGPDDPTPQTVCVPVP